MVERVKLTSEFIDSLEPPSRGERWIADTVVRGFGIRLWSNNSGGHKAYAVRVSDRHGKARRKTYKPWERVHWRALWLVSDGVDDGKLFADALDDARQWAATQIKIYKKSQNQLAQSSESLQNYDNIARLVSNLSLETGTSSILAGLDSHVVSQVYKLRLLRASNFLPCQFKKQTLASLDMGKLINDLQVMKTPASTRLDLVTLLSKTYKAAAYFAPGLEPKFQSLRSLTQQWRSNTSSFGTELWLNSELPEKFHNYLMAEKNFWQQALCIATSFKTHLPIAVIMRSKWSQVDNGFWWPYRPEERKRWRAYRYHLKGDLQKVFKSLSTHSKQIPGGSAYLFPSPYNSDAHIVRIETMRKALVQEFNLPDISVLKIAEQCRELSLRNLQIDW